MFGKLKTANEVAAMELRKQGKNEPYGHCDSCGKVCDGSGGCPCGGPIAIERQAQKRYGESSVDFYYRTQIDR